MSDRDRRQETIEDVDTPDEVPQLLNLERFKEREPAISLISRDNPAMYSRALLDFTGADFEMTTGVLLFQAFIARFRGLHEGSIDAISANNPHAALPLARSWMEAVTIGLYVARFPEYGEAVMNGPRKAGVGRKSFEAMFHAVREDASQLRLVYHELSEYSHFGPLAVWNSFSIDSEDGCTVSWSDAPHWRDDTHFQMACAQAYELIALTGDVLARLGPILIGPPQSQRKQ